MHEELKNYSGRNPFIKYLKLQNRELTPFESEYLEQNMRYCGYNLDLKLSVGRRSADYLNAQFQTSKEISEISVDMLWGETSEVYHFGYKSHSLFCYKSDTQNPFLKEIQNVEFDPSVYENNKWSRKLFDYQIDGIKFMKLRNPAFCWDSMGLGKSTQSILAAVDSGYKKILVITLASLKLNWRREIENYHYSTKIISGSQWDDSPSTEGQPSFTIINYEILKNFCVIKKAKKQTGSNQLLLENFDCIILDEVHRAKQPSSIQASVIQQITKNKKVIGLSGTPFEKNIDLYNICRVLNVSISDLINNNAWWDEKAQNYKEFATRYCNAYEQVLDSPKDKKEKSELLSLLPIECHKHKYIKSLLNVLQQYGNTKVKQWYFQFDESTGLSYKKYFTDFNIQDIEWVQKNRHLFPEKRKKVMVLGRYEDGKKVENTHSIELNQRIKHLQILRKKEDVLHNFPEKFIYSLYFGLTMSEKAEYLQLWADYMALKNENKYTDDELEKMSQSIKTREFLAKIKVPHTVNYVENKTSDGYKVIIFTHFKEEYELLLEQLGKIAVGINASMSAQKKQDIIDKFQSDDKVRVIVGNIKTLGTGHNLTKGDVVINNSPDWNSGEHEQSEDRAYRIGRTEDVTVYYCLFEDTHEEQVYERSIQKKENKQILLNQK